MSILIKFKKIDANAKLPVKGSSAAACYDVYAHSITFMGNKAVVGLGFMTEIPPGFHGVVIPRSNLTKHNWVLNNSMGIIDSDYRGEWKMIFTPINAEDFPYGIDQRVGQIYFEKDLAVDFTEVKELTASVRGEGGFGSTGLK